jgi:hypothetical protein
MSVGQRAERSRLSRRDLLKAAGGLAVGGVALETIELGSGAQLAPALMPRVAAPPAPFLRFHSRPDLRPPAVASAGAPARSSNYLLLGPGSANGAQAGPLIVDGRGEPIWFRPMHHGVWATNFRVQQYQGAPVLTWWEGTVDKQGYGHGEAVIVDSRYREIARFRGGGGRPVDLHELVLTPQGTALMTCYPEIVSADLSGVGGPRDGTVFESILQEVEVPSGRVVMEWRSLDHVPISDSYRQPGGTYDYLHLNSIEVLPSGDLLVSARHTWALYKLDRRTGAVVWRLGGKRTDFALDRALQFSWQHDARRPAHGVLTVFDDGSDGPTKTDSQSRGLRFQVDARRRTVRLAAEYHHPNPLLASAMGNVQLLAGGHTLIGWGARPYISEFSSDASLVTDYRLAAGQQSYRAFSLPWRGTPSDPPTIAVRRQPRGAGRMLYASWNGATDVDRWEVYLGDLTSSLRSVGTVARAGFETAVPLRATGSYVAVAALDSSGQRIGLSDAVRL